MLINEREQIIREKEEAIKNKENELKSLINKIEEDKKKEEDRLQELQDFLYSIPFSLDDVYDATLTQIQGAEADLDPIFQSFNDNEFEYFRNLYEIFDNYSKYFNEDKDYGEFIDINAVKHFFLTYIDPEYRGGNEFDTIQKQFCDFVNKYQNTEFKFLDFMFCIISVLYYNNNLNSLDLMPYHINYIFNTFKSKQNEEIYLVLFKDDLVVTQFKSHLKFLVGLFNDLSDATSVSDYREISMETYSKMLHTLLNANKQFDIIELRRGQIVESGLSFYAFLEKIVTMALLNVKDQDENFIKVSIILEAFQRAFPQFIPKDDFDVIGEVDEYKEEVIGNQDEVTENKILDSKEPVKSRSKPNTDKYMEKSFDSV